MIFNRHSNLVGQHAFLSASKYHWVNYDEEKLDRAFVAAMAARRGTELHQFAHDAIRLGIRLPRTKNTMNMYVNDGVGYRMTPELVLYYSDNCFGTADCLSFRKGVLRVHDLKTGITPTSFRQLEIYAALFCHEYKFKPSQIEMEFRIYQNNEVNVLVGDHDVVTHIMDTMVTFDDRINRLKAEIL